MFNLLKIFNSDTTACQAPEDCPIKKAAQSLKVNNALTLDKLSPGESAVVKSVCEAEPRLCCKLHAMGIVEGQKISVKQRAPFGDPISIGTLGYTLSLRLCEAQAVEVVRE